MHARARLLFGTAALALLVTFVPASPASSHTAVCVDTVTMSLSIGFGLPVLTSNTGNYSIRPSFVCSLIAEQLQANGTITGACGLATGAGTTTTGHDFTLAVTGPTVVFTGEVYAVGIMVPDPTGGSCTNKTATRFLLTSVFVLVH